MSSDLMRRDSPSKSNKIIDSFEANNIERWNRSHSFSNAISICVLQYIIKVLQRSRSIRGHVCVLCNEAASALTAASNVHCNTVAKLRNFVSCILTSVWFLMMPITTFRWDPLTSTNINSFAKSEKRNEKLNTNRDWIQLFVQNQKEEPFICRKIDWVFKIWFKLRGSTWKFWEA